MRPFRIAAGLLLAAIGAAGCGVARGETGASGRELYAACESCHGTAGEGNALLAAPTIAGLPRWYVAAQLQRFQTGLRGKHPDDIEGLRMRAMAQQMLSTAEIEAVASHVAQLPPVAPAASLATADPKAGQPFYAVCSACHGVKGEGNEQLNAPPLAGLDDWYVARQLRKFQSGIRGRIADDVVGLQMAAMAMTVPAESVDHVAAYVQTLRK